jgi:hypothetical protein
VSTEDDLRELALSLPGTHEQEAWGMPTWRVGGKIFAALNPKHGPGVKIPQGERAELVAADPAKFYWTAHDEGANFMRVHLAAIGRGELLEVLTDAWRFTAGPKLANGLSQRLADSSSTVVAGRSQTKPRHT